MELVTAVAPIDIDKDLTCRFTKRTNVATMAQPQKTQTDDFCTKDQRLINTIGIRPWRHIRRLNMILMIFIGK